ncbi:hypothetical protein EAH81_26990 [Flavobacterium pectinovorum]|uniref:Uncharacterized protein n=1 Tax=Flavobacterium pectinovorum TaxID=29533 RepID=A0A502E158_9FLAO|nr:hypothetical protein EAH81_26990 [Flavobacterium pectinovorum]
MEIEIFIVLNSKTFRIKKDAVASFFLLSNLKTGISTVVISLLKNYFANKNDIVTENRKVSSKWFYKFGKVNTMHKAKRN